MISMDVFFKQMRKWVYRDTDRPLFTGIYCDGERAIATDTHGLAIVKNWKAPAGYIDVDGRPVKDKGKFADFSGVTQPSKDWDWLLMVDENTMKRLRDFCAYAEKLNRGKGRKSKGTILGLYQHGEQVSLYCVNDVVRLYLTFSGKVEVATNDEAYLVAQRSKTSTHTDYVDAARLKNALDFLLTTKALHAIIGTKNKTMRLESSELYLTIAGFYIGPNSTNNQGADLQAFMNGEIRNADCDAQEAAGSMFDA